MICQYKLNLVHIYNFNYYLTLHFICLSFLSTQQLLCTFYSSFAHVPPFPTFMLIQSTLLQCLLGELHPVRGTVEVKGKVAYVSQDPWLFTGTLRDNILFGCPFYVDWYDAVLDACALHQVWQYMCPLQHC